MIFVLGLAGLLIAYNALLNALSLQERRLYLPVNLAGAAVLVLIGRARGLSWEALGLGAGGIGLGLALGGVIAVLIAGGLAMAWAVPGLHGLLHDRRMAQVDARELAYRALLRIPLGTALAEEVAFRGVLFGVWAAHQPEATALAGSSLAFGLWHIVPTLTLLRVNRIGRTTEHRVVGVAIGVAATTLAGAGLGYLRILTGGIVGPVVVHASVNSLGAVAAFIVQTRERLSSRHPRGPRGATPGRRRGRPTR
ncbi:MAG: lysostaphin resistance A-like protein [Acidimicrobiia bacterium]